MFYDVSSASNSGCELARYMGTPPIFPSNSANCALVFRIVVWKTDQGVAAIPLYTLSEARLRAARLEEFVSICTEPTWVGETPWAGMPLLAKFNAAYNCEERCFADLSRPHWISGHEPFFDDVGKIVGGEYSKLMDLLSKKEREFRTAAFARFIAIKRGK